MVTHVNCLPFIRKKYNPKHSKAKQNKTKQTTKNHNNKNSELKTNRFDNKHIFMMCMDTCSEFHMSTCNLFEFYTLFDKIDKLRSVRLGPMN